jgi:hypothetical protein
MLKQPLKTHAERQKNDDPYCKFKDDNQRTVALVSRHRWEFWGKVVSAITVVAVVWITSSSPFGVKLAVFLITRMGL